MKRAIYFAVISLASCFIGTLIFATLFMFSCNLTMFVTGFPTPVFSLNFFLNGLLATFPLVCLLTQILLILYMVRHPKNQLLALLVYALFSLLFWLLLIPLDLKIMNRYEADALEPRVETLSEGIFRKEENGVFFYSRINREGHADGLFFDTTGFLGSDGGVMPFFDVPVTNESAFPYSDVLIKSSLEPPKLVTYPMAVYSSLLTSALYSVSQGFLAWLSFASMGLALIMLYGFQYLSSWKLANVSCVITGFISILFINYLYYMNIMPAPLKELSLKLSRLLPVKDPFILVINLSFAILICLAGVIMGIYRLRGTSILETEE
ncbi:MAG: hypothetical protein K5873_02225 [Treponema sp.]|nr:hypothetical protein [Treponema sp.]